MKKHLSAITLIAVLLAALLLCTGCMNNKVLGSDANDPNAPNNGSNNNQPPADPLNKAVVVSSLNLLDLKSFTNTATDSLSDISKNAMSADISMTMDDETVKALLAVKDGFLYILADETDELLIHIADGSFDTFYGYEGKWEVPERNDYGDNFVGMENPMGLLALLEKFTLPELTEADLTEKDGMLVVSNAYILKFMEANIPIFAGTENVPEDDKAEFMEEIEEALNMLGLEIAFNSGREKLSAISVKLNPTTDDIEIKSMRALIRLNDEATALKEIDFELLPSEDAFPASANARYALKVSTVLDGDKIQKAEIEGEMFSSISMGQDSTIDSDGNYSSGYESIYETYKLKASFDLTKANEAGAKVFEGTLKINPVYGEVTTESGNHYTGQHSSETHVMTSEELKSKGTTIDASAYITAEGNDRFTIRVDATFEGETFRLTGTLDMKNATGFPASLPKAVTDYLNPSL